MYKFIISAATAGAALMLAYPASAQRARPTYPYQTYGNAYQAYSYPYQSYNYGYQAGYGFANRNVAGNIQARVQAIRSNIQSLKMRRAVSPREARRLDNEAKLIERHIYMNARNGIQGSEARNLEIRIQRLERNIAMESTDWNNRPGRYWRG